MGYDVDWKGRVMIYVAGFKKKVIENKLELKLEQRMCRLIVSLMFWKRTLYCRLYEGVFCVFYEYGCIDGVIGVIGHWMVVLGTSYKSLRKYMVVLSVK